MKQTLSEFTNSLSTWQRFMMVFVTFLFPKTVQNIQEETIDIVLNQVMKKNTPQKE